MSKDKTGIELITQERQRQVEKEGWTLEHDDEHKYGEISAAAACYAINKHEMKDDIKVEVLIEEMDFLVNDGDRGDRKLLNGWYDAFPWKDGDKRNDHSRIKSLIIAGALIAAEIDRLQRIKTEKG